MKRFGGIMRTIPDQRDTARQISDPKWQFKNTWNEFFTDWPHIKQLFNSKLPRKA